MNILQITEMLKRMPDADLQTLTQNPSPDVPSWALLTETNRRNRTRQDAQAGTGAPPTVAQQLTQQIGQQQPVPTQIPQPGAQSQPRGLGSMMAQGAPKGYARGGIVTFKDGGIVTIAQTKGYLGSDEEEARSWLRQQGFDDTGTPMYPTSGEARQQLMQSQLGKATAYQSQQSQQAQQYQQDQARLRAEIAASPSQGLSYSGTGVPTNRPAQQAQQVQQQRADMSANPSMYTGYSTAGVPAIRSAYPGNEAPQQASGINPQDPREVAARRARMAAIEAAKPPQQPEAGLGAAKPPQQPKAGLGALTTRNRPAAIKPEDLKFMADLAPVDVNKRQEEQAKYYGDDEYGKAMAADLAERRKKAAEDKAANIDQTKLDLFLNMMATKDPNFAGGLGTAGLEALKGYRTREEGLSAEEKAIRKETLGEVGRKQTEKHGRVTEAITKKESVEATNRAQEANKMQMLNKLAEYNATLAKDLYNTDRQVDAQLGVAQRQLALGQIQEANAAFNAAKTEVASLYKEYHDLLQNDMSGTQQTTITARKLYEDAASRVNDMSIKMQQKAFPTAGTTAKKGQVIARATK